MLRPYEYKLCNHDPLLIKKTSSVYDCTVEDVEYYLLTDVFVWSDLRTGNQHA